MTSFTTPARGRWPRDNTTGATQDQLAPGGMAVNWPDRKIYVGGPNGNPLLFSQRLREFDPTLAYTAEDVVFYDGTIVRADTDQPPSPSPSGSGWTVVVGGGFSNIFDASITGLITGGDIALSSGTQVSVAAGSGVVVNNTSVEIPDVTLVSWGGFAFNLTDPGEQWTLLGVTASGEGTSIALTAADEATWRRQNILLGGAFWSGGAIAGLIDLSQPAAQTAENFRDLYFSQGGAFRAEGLRLLAGADPFSIDFSAGTVYSAGASWRTAPTNPNLLEVPGIMTADLVLVTRGAIQDDEATAVDPANYDLGGTLTPVPAGKWTIQYVSADASFSDIYVQYGQTLYDSAFAAAEQLPADYEALSPFVGNQYLVLCGAIITGPDDTGLVSSRVINALNDPNPFVGASAQEAGAFLPLDGSQPMTGPINVDENGIVNAGPISGGTIQCRSASWT